MLRNKTPLRTAELDGFEGWTPNPEVIVEGPRFSSLLGLDGLPLAYPKVRLKMGFDLTPKVKP